MSRKTRLDLHEELCDILGSRNVYFQPPEKLKLNFPCIIYERNSMWSVKADNDKYLNRVRYTVTLVDLDPESKYVDRILDLDYCSYDRHLVVDNMNHDVFTIYI